MERARDLKTQTDIILNDYEQCKRDLDRYQQHGDQTESELRNVTEEMRRLQDEHEMTK